jgi:uncharacterized phage protein gp47/JayE
MPVPIPVISAAGITLPSYNDVLLGFQQGYASVYGVDVSIEPDDIDGQWIAIIAQAYFDLSQMVGVMYNFWGVLNTTGAMLDNICALTNVKRQAATYSTAVVTLTGTAYSSIINGLVGDDQNLNTTWTLPTPLTIPASGTLNVTATCTTAGAITAAPGTLTQILAATAGWQAVTNVAAAIPGAAVETDAQLVQQQQIAVSAGALTPMATIAAAVGKVAGVSEVGYYNNDSNLTVNGVPPGNFALIVAGGDTQAIGTAIASKKPPGVPSYGDISAVVIDTNGVPDTVNWFALALVELQVQITLKAKTGYQAQTGLSIQTAVAAFLNAFTPGQTSYLNDLYVPAKLNNTYVISNIQQGIAGVGLAPADLIPLIYQQYFTDAADISIIVT